MDALDPALFSPGRPAPRRGRVWALRLTLLCVGLVAGCVLAEVALQLTSGPERYAIWPPGMTTPIALSEGQLRGVSASGTFVANSQGFRATEPPSGNGLRILAVGGSTTECLYLDQSKAWPARVEAALNAQQSRRRVWIANAGVSGLTTRDHQLQLRHLLPQHPEFDLLLLLVGVNDLALHLAQGATRETDARRQLKRVFRVFPRHHLPLHRRSLLHARLRTVSRWLRGKGAEPLDGAFYARKWRHRREARRIIDQLPDLSAALAEFRTNLQAMLALATRHRLRVVLITQPYLWRADLPEELEALLWFGWASGAEADEAGLEYYSAAALAEGMARYNRVLREVAQDNGLPLVDLEPRIPRDTTAFYDDVHFNERGAERVAKAVTEVLLPLVDGRR